MSLPITAASHAVAAVAKTAPDQALSPAKQAKAADPAVKGAGFGALVAQLAKARQTAPVDPTAEFAADGATSGAALTV